MDNFKKTFKGKRVMRTFQRRFYIVSGIVELTIGLFGLFNIDPSENLFLLSFMLLIVGTTYVILGLKGKLMLPEHNYLVIQDGLIEFKNGHQKPKSFSIDKIEDVIVKKTKAEINAGRMGRFIYDFSVFSNTERNEIIQIFNELKNEVTEL